MVSVVPGLMAGPGLSQSADEQQMRDLTSNVLAGITGTPAPQSANPAADTDAIKVLIEQAVSEGQSDAYLDALINEAADKGEIEVPAQMRTTEGRVDTQVLLSTLVEKSLAEQSGNSGDILAQIEAEAAANAEPRYYTVESGDSLASISLRYYGDALQYDRIYQANREEVRSADRIRVGQKLLIP